MTSWMLYTLSIFCIGQIDFMRGLEVRIGALFTTDRCCDILSYEDKASALNIAIDHLHNDGVLSKDEVTFK